MSAHCFRRSNRTSDRHASSSADFGPESHWLLLGHDKPLPVGTEVRLCISHHDTTFTALGVVASCQPNMGMGVRFADVQLDQHAVLDKWLAELV